MLLNRHQAAREKNLAAAAQKAKGSPEAQLDSLRARLASQAGDLTAATERIAELEELLDESRKETAEARERIAELEEGSGVETEGEGEDDDEPKKPVDKLTKAELAQLAKDEFGVELDPEALKRDELLDEVKKLIADKASASGDA